MLPIASVGAVFSSFPSRATPADTAKVAADTKTQERWAIMKAMQEPLPTRQPGEWWAQMEEVFHAE